MVLSISQKNDRKIKRSRYASCQIQNTHRICIAFSQISRWEIIGAGAGGFFMMVVPKNVNNYLKIIKDRGYKILPWSFDRLGTHEIDY
jgi:hypothetical protein